MIVFCLRFRAKGLRSSAFDKLKASKNLAPMLKVPVEKSLHD